MPTAGSHFQPLSPVGADVCLYVVAVVLSDFVADVKFDPMVYRHYNNRA